MGKKTKSATQSFLSVPDDFDIPIWRYMDFTKYIALLIEKALFFSRADHLLDPFEGSISRGNYKLRPEIYKDTKIPPEAFEQMSEFLPKVR